MWEENACGLLAEPIKLFSSRVPLDVGIFDGRKDDPLDWIDG